MLQQEDDTNGCGVDLGHQIKFNCNSIKSKSILYMKTEKIVGGQY